MQPTIGRIVHYALTEQDAAEINRRRVDFDAYRRDHNTPTDPGQPGRTGHIAHVGNRAEEGQVYPATIVRVWGENPDSAVNLQVQLDGTDTFWATSRSVGEGPGHFAWPVRS